MFESCRAHSPRKSARFAGMTTSAGSLNLKVGERRRAKPACAASF
jgi:hypothetical protein